MRCIIISQPKSGTYLCSNILKNLNIRSSNIHLGLGSYVRISEISNDNKIHYQDYEIKKPIEKSIELIEDDHFTVGHIPYKLTYENILMTWKKILITRDIQECKESASRFLIESNLDNRKLKRNKTWPRFSAIEDWKGVSGVFHITFNDMINKNTEKINDLQIFLFGSIRQDSHDVLIRSLKEDSLTKSNKRRSNELV